MKRNRLAQRLAWLASLALLTGCANDLTDTLIEAPLGKLSELAIGLQFRMDKDPLVYGYTNLIGQEQRELVRRKNVPYRFRVVEMEEPNAFAIPYGGVYVTKGLLRFADSEDEIAFVMGHEIGHVERRHGSLAFQRNLLVSLGLSLLTSNNNEDWMQLAYLGNYFLDLHWSRENEHSADREGAMYALNSGHDPAAGIEFFRKLDDRYGSTPRFWSYFQTHPINRDRIAAIKAQPQLEADPVPLTLIADGYRQRGLMRHAEAHYREAVAADDNYGPAYLGLARIEAWRGENAIARQHYLDAMSRGVDPELVNAELASLPEGEPAPGLALVLASASEVDSVRHGLTAVALEVAQVSRVGQAIWDQPLDAVPALVNSHNLAGQQLDNLYRATKSKQPKVIQDLITGGQRIRTEAMRSAADVGTAQEQAELAIQMMEENRERITRKLEAEATVAELAAARAVLTDSERGSREVREGLQRLNEQVPEVERVINHAHQAINVLQQAMTATRRPARYEDELGALLANVQGQINTALDQAQRSRDAVYNGRVRGLQSSIDITMVDRPANERAAARRILARFLLVDPGAVGAALDSGLSYGEAAYVLGIAKSAGEEPAEAVTLAADLERANSVDKLSSRLGGRNHNVAIILKLIDEALRDEFDPTI